MSRLPATRAQTGLVIWQGDARPAAHPDWCAGDHHCTADRLPEGEHASIPEIWDTDLGRLVAVRYRSRDGRRDHVEIRLSTPLDPADDAEAEVQARMVIATVYASLLNLAAVADL
jgi:hypothetical protein